MTVSISWPYKGAFVFGLALFGCAFAGGLVYELITEQRLPSPSVNPYAKAAAYVQRGEYEKAIAEYRQGTRVQPRHGQARFYLGVALLNRKRYREAEVELVRAVPLLPEDPRVYNNLGVALINQDKTELAIKSFAVAVKLAPANGNYLANLRAATGEAQKSEIRGQKGTGDTGQGTWEEEEGDGAQWRARVR